jgi:hypothetical protein
VNLLTELLNYLDTMHFPTENLTLHDGRTLSKNTMQSPLNAGETVLPHAQFAYPERDPKLPFPILTLSHPPPIAGPSGTQYDRHFPSLFNVHAETDEEEYLVGDSEGELVLTPSSPELKPICMSTVAPAFGSSTRTVWDMPMWGSCYICASMSGSQPASILDWLLFWDLAASCSSGCRSERVFMQ